MAGEIFIAKEATSQDIKTIVDANGNALSSLSTNLSTANASINTIKSDIATVKTNVDTVLTNVKRLEGTKYRSYGIDFATVISSLTQHVSVTGGGYLISAYLAAVSSSANVYSGRIKIVIDNATIIDIDSLNTTNRLSNGQSIGVLNKNSVRSVSSAGDVYPAGAMQVINGTSIKNSMAATIPNSAAITAPQGGLLFFLPEYIRFNTSLKISCLKTAQIEYGIEYILD